MQSQKGNFFKNKWKIENKRKKVRKKRKFQKKTLCYKKGKNFALKGE